MIVLEKYKLIQKLMGLDPQGGFEKFILRFIFSIVFILCFSTITIYFISNIHDDVYRVWAVLTSDFPTVSLMSSYFHLMIYRGRYQSLLNDLQDIVNESTEPEFNFLNIEIEDAFTS